MARWAAEVGGIVEEHATTWFPELAAPVRVRVLDSRRRLRGSLVSFRCTDTAGATRDVVVKTSAGSASTEGGSRPRLSSVASAAERASLEPAALRAAGAHFAASGDARLGVVRVLAHTDDPAALLLERVEAPSLQIALTKAWPAHLVGRHPLRDALCAAGRWLRTFHDMPSLPHTRERHTTVPEVVDAIRRAAGYVGAVADATDLLRRASDYGTALAAASLPPALPLVVAHGDFTPRNLLQGPGVRLTGFDFMARWCTAPYEDIAYFLTDLRAGRAQRLSGGRALPRAALVGYEEAFLSGYYGSDPVPRSALAVYEVLMLLDLWAAVLARSRTATTRRESRAIARLLADYVRRGAQEFPPA
jgi:aminoglycoside phosphotransferase (APT) family kinase protein